MSTNVVSSKDIKRQWHLIDAKDRILGRLATEVATMLSGKTKHNYVPYLDNGDYVVVINAAQVRVSGKKEQQKEYSRHSGYPGGLRQESLSDLRKRKPMDIITKAVWGMTPKTKLGKQMIKKLHVFSDANHSYADKLKGDKDAK